LPPSERRGWDPPAGGSALTVAVARQSMRPGWRRAKSRGGILTAGHCLAGKDANGFQVVVGRDGNLLSPRQLAAHALKIKGFALHPYFREAFPFAHDRPENAIAIDDVGLILLASTPAGTVQVGITSWGPETMDGACGEKPLPAVEMRTSAYTRFIHSAKPANEPFSQGSGTSRIVGTARVGRTVTCRPPKLGGGGRSRLTYSWQVTRRTALADVPGAHRATLRITRAV
jgi:hypothetical protein